jgi:hypothetical protein
VLRRSHTVYYVRSHAILPLASVPALLRTVPLNDNRSGAPQPASTWTKTRATVPRQSPGPERELITEQTFSYDYLRAAGRTEALVLTQTGTVVMWERRPSVYVQLPATLQSSSWQLLGPAHTAGFALKKDKGVGRSVPCAGSDKPTSQLLNACLTAGILAKTPLHKLCMYGGRESRSKCTCNLDSQLTLRTYLLCARQPTAC